MLKRLTGRKESTVPAAVANATNSTSSSTSTGSSTTTSASTSTSSSTSTGGAPSTHTHARKPTLPTTLTRTNSQLRTTPASPAHGSTAHPSSEHTRRPSSAIGSRSMPPKSTATKHDTNAKHDHKKPSSSSSTTTTPATTATTTTTTTTTWDESELKISVPGSIEQRIARLENAINTFLSACRASAPLDIIDRELCSLRKVILFYGIPTTPKTSTEASLRGRIWNIMLAVDKVDAASYMDLVSKGKCTFPIYKKIRGDSFRTFQNDADYQSVVKETEIIRCLNSFVLEQHHTTFKNEQNHPQNLTFTYVQGLNTVCGPLLYCMPEVEAYAAFCKISTKLSPWYWTSSHIGVQAGCKLLDQCLEVLDPELFDHLRVHHLEAYVYAFHCVSSLSASIPPFKELIKLWDFLLAFGVHFNILCVAAQIISFRDAVLESNNPKSVLDYRTWPRLRARYVISIAMQLLPKLPPELYHTICLHATDQATVEQVTGRKIHDVV